jgi:hypothetical protein
MSALHEEPAALLLATAVLALSFVQVRACPGDDPRLEALRGVVSLDLSRFGDVNPSLQAARRLARQPPAPLYDDIGPKGSHFIYPPLAAALYRPVVGLGPERARRTLVVANHVVFALILAALAAFAGSQPGLPRLAPFAAVAAAVPFYPLLRALQVNQAGLLVALLLGISHLALARGRHRIAGVSFALACAVKPHLALVLLIVVGALPAFSAAVAVAGALLLAVSLAWAGLANHLAYVRDVLPMVARGYVFLPNQSWNALFGRLLLDQDMHLFALAPFDARVQALSLLAGALCCLAAFWAIQRGGRTEPVGALGLAWLSVTLLSPVSWEHHYAPALFLLVWAWGASRRMGVRHVRPALALAYALMASYFAFGPAPGPWLGLLASYVLYGGLVLLAASTMLVRRAHRPE